MSAFFGFDPMAPPGGGGHQSTAPGFGSTPDHFAGLSSRDRPIEDTDALDFEDDSLGGQLDETDDAFNDDTFGGGPATQETMRPDFDFFGQTAKIAGAMHEDHLGFPGQQPSRPTAKPAKHGYEAYREPAYIPAMEPDASIWGMQPKKSTPSATQAPVPAPSANKKIMSLEEVEASMRQSKKPQVTHQPHQAHQQMGEPQDPLMTDFRGGPSQQNRHSGYGPYPMQPGFNHGPPPSMPQPAMDPRFAGQFGPPVQAQMMPNDRQSPQVNQYKQPPQMPQVPQAAGRGQNMGPFPPMGPGHHSVPSGHMNDSARAAYVAEAQRTAKRNHKIQQMSKYNGVMTPQDKNFITRIQLQSLMTATGNTEQDPEAANNEDWYYQVYSAMRTPPGSTAQQQSASQFSQTYNNSYGGRYGSGRRQPRGGDNHSQRMEQQVQRAVEAAKAKPKNTQLVIAGSLGKIAYSNAKTPKPLLNIQRSKPGTAPKTTKHSLKAIFDISNRKVEYLYSKIMEIEDHKRKMPPAPATSPEGHSRLVAWENQNEQLRGQMWRALQTNEPVEEDPEKYHPFMAILTWQKGKKLMPRIFNNLEDEQKLIIIALVTVHFDSSEVIRYGQDTHSAGSFRLIKEDIQLWHEIILPCIFSYVTDAPIKTVTGVAGILLEHSNIEHNLRTQIGVEYLTMFISRAEILRRELDPAQIAADSDWEHWTTFFNSFFSRLEPVLPHLFPEDIHTHDTYIWQFLAAVGAGANPQQQQLLVLGVKDRVMQAVKVGRTLPDNLKAERLGRVNLFLHAIGLDETLLD